MDFDPPLDETLETLSSLSTILVENDDPFVVAEECELPLINLGYLMSPDPTERENCAREIVQAARNWGFFQVTNHGISEEVLKNMNYEERKMFHQPFNKKVKSNGLGYRWGNPRATSLKQLSWSEAFHISMADLSGMNEQCKSLRESLENFSKFASGLSRTLAGILVQNLGLANSTYFQENCSHNSSYLRMNRYPPCPHSSSKMIFGIIPHTDSDFISIVYQDQVGGLQLFKDGRWIAVKPNAYALVVNIGDLFQALSNGIYKSIKHRVVASQAERFSAAYFYCPKNDAVIESLSELEPPIYRHFTFREYQRQNQKDVQDTGDKIGLERFLLYPQYD